MHISGGLAFIVVTQRTHPLIAWLSLPVGLVFSGYWDGNKQFLTGCHPSDKHQWNSQKGLSPRLALKNGPLRVSLPVNLNLDVKISPFRTLIVAPRV